MTEEKDDEAPESSEEQVDREAILARRARFVATALLGMTVLPACDPMPRPCLEVEPMRTSSDPQPPPMPCLSPVPNPPPSAASSDAPDAGPPPMPCLEIAPQPPPSASSGGAADAGPPPPPPQPCLSVVKDPKPPPPPPPQPCLTPVRPKSNGQ